MRVLLATGERRGRKDQKARPPDICQASLPPKIYFQLQSNSELIIAALTETRRWFPEGCASRRRQNREGAPEAASRSRRRREARTDSHTQGFGHFVPKPR